MGSPRDNYGTVRFPLDCCQSKHAVHRLLGVVSGLSRVRTPASANSVHLSLNGIMLTGSNWPN